MKAFRLLYLLFFTVTLTVTVTSPTSGQILASRAIADINPGSSGSFPTNFIVYKNSLYFSATIPAYGRELWKFDGTNVNLVSNINNTVTGTIGNDSTPAGFVIYSNLLYFSAFEPTNGDELYRYDCTNVVRITDINPGSGNSFPQQLTVMSNELFFSANSGASKPNYELWKYNGTTASLVANIHTDSGGSDFSSYPSGITLFNGALYFMADDGTHGYELWKASSTGATLLADINPGGESSSSYPQGFTAFKSKLYFEATTSTYGYELWQTDGTNTSQVADLNPGSNSSYPQGLTVFRNVLYFQADDGTNGYELWKYDGAVLSLVSNINLTGDSFPQNLTVLSSNLLFFSANDGVHGWELWKYDGTNASLVTDLNPGGDSFPENLIVLSNVLYFTATTPDTGYEWWKCDGSNVTLAADIVPGPGSSYPDSPVIYNGSLCFSAIDDGIADSEPWTIWTAPFQITSIQPSSGGFQLTWTTVGGITNVVQSSDTINGPFSDLSTPITILGNGNTVTNFIDLTNACARFYRVVQR